MRTIKTYKQKAHMRLPQNLLSLSAILNLRGYKTYVTGETANLAENKEVCDSYTLVCEQDILLDNIQHEEIELITNQVLKFRGSNFTILTETVNDYISRNEISITNYLYDIFEGLVLSKYDFLALMKKKKFAYLNASDAFTTDPHKILESILYMSMGLIPKKNIIKNIIQYSSYVKTIPDEELYEVLINVMSISDLGVQTLNSYGLLQYFFKQPLHHNELLNLPSLRKMLRYYQSTSKYIDPVVLVCLFGDLHLDILGIPHEHTEMVKETLDVYTNFNEQEFDFSEHSAPSIIRASTLAKLLCYNDSSLREYFKPLIVYQSKL